MTDDTTDEGESEDVNQYGGGEQDIDAVEQTDRVTEEGGDGDEGASEEEQGEAERTEDE